jgi:hypothetical protein
MRAQIGKWLGLGGAGEGGGDARVDRLAGAHVWSTAARPTSTSRSYPILAPQSEWAVFTLTATTGQLSPTGGDWSFDLTGIPAAIR